MKQRYFRSLSLGLLAVLTALACILSACPMGNDDSASTVDDSITLSGTIGAVTVNGNPYSGEINIQARKQNGDGLPGTGIRYEGNSGAWSITIPKTNLTSVTSIRFQVNIKIGDSWLRWDIPDVTRTYNGSDISGIALGDVSATAVTLSGTIDAITVNDAAPSGDIYIQARTQENGEYLGETRYDGSGTWSIPIPSTALDAGTSISFRVNIKIGDSWQSRDMATATYTGEDNDISDIALGSVNIEAVILSGTIGKVTVNGNPYSGEINIQARRQNGNGLGGTGTRYEGNSGTWSISISPTDIEEDASITFQVGVRIGGSWRFQDIPNVARTYAGESISDIDLGNVSIEAVTLSGTIGKVTVNGDDYSGEINIQARRQNGNGLGGTGIRYEGNSGTWSISISPTDIEEDASITFEVSVRIGDSWRSQNIPNVAQTYRGESILNIDLGDVKINFVTLSGTIGVITVNGKPYSGHIVIQPRKQGGGGLGGIGMGGYNGKSATWSLTIPSTDIETGTSITFQVNINDSDRSWDIPGVTRTYDGKSISDIALGNVSINFVTLSGTIGPVTVNGNPYSGEINIEVRKQNSGGLSGTRINYDGKSGTWSITIPTANLEDGDSIYFWVNIRIGDSWRSWNIPGVMQTYNGGDILNIALGNIALP